MDYRVQIEIPFEEDAGTPEARLESRLTELLGEPVVLRCTDNRRTMISATRRREALYLRLHRMFLRADSIIVNALAKYLRRGRDSTTSRLISGFIERHRGVLAESVRQPDSFVTEGKTHDLAEIFADINKTYFDSKVDGVAITWGRKLSSRRRRRTIKLGTYNPDEKLIRVHPALDRELVPRYFVEYIVYHEILHHLIPVKMGKSRRIVHSAQFRAREREFPHYVKALTWEARNIGELMRGARV